MRQVHLTKNDFDLVANRLRRARGQIDGILKMIEDDRDCVDIVTQLAAVSKAIDRSGFALIAAGLRACHDGQSDPELQARLEKMFLSLA